MAWSSFKEDIDARRDDLRHLRDDLKENRGGVDDSKPRAILAACERLLDHLEAIFQISTGPSEGAARRALEAEARSRRLERELGTVRHTKDIVENRLANIQAATAKELTLLRHELTDLRQRLERERSAGAAKLARAEKAAATARRAQSLMWRPRPKSAYRPKGSNRRAPK